MTLCRSAFRYAISSARAVTSLAVTRAEGNSIARATARQPLPVPTSAIWYRRTHALWMDFLRPVISTVTTTLTLRLCYAVLTAIGSSFVLPHAQTGESPGLAVPPVPSILHLVHACIAALLLAIQFTPFLRPQDIAEHDHPIARKCLAQFIAGWRWAWVTWLMLYCWLWVNANSAAGPM